MKILLIEDNEANRYLVTYLLEQAGHKVVQAYTGPTGLACARVEPFDLILLDIQLPGMDGYAVARALRTLPGLATVPVVAVTSHALSGDREKALEAGCTSYLEKPIDPDTFLAEIHHWLTAAPESGSPTTPKPLSSSHD